MRVRRGKGNGEIIIMYMCLISSSDVYIHCAQVWYSWPVLLEAISIAWLPAPSCTIAIYITLLINLPPPSFFHPPSFPVIPPFFLHPSFINYKTTLYIEAYATYDKQNNN